MITEKILERVLIQPARDGASSLIIVSGYASPGMLESHLERLALAGLSPSISLVIGMTKGSLDAQDRRSYQEIVRRDWNGPNVSGVFAIRRGQQVHSKVYVWSGPKGCMRAFAGSANYSVSAMIQEQTREVCAEVDWHAAKDYADACLSDARSIVVMTGDRRRWKEAEANLRIPEADLGALRAGQYVDIPLLVLGRRGARVAPSASGINWGQRLGRDPNEAYLSLPPAIREFFPEPPARFMVYTRSQGGFVAVRAQSGGKALLSTTNNSILGRMLRAAVGRPSGAFVRTEDIQQSGMSTVRCYKLSEGDYFLDL